MSKLEKEEKEKLKTKQREERIAELEEHSSKNWVDPYAANAKLRGSFRKEKRKRVEQLEKDIELTKQDRVESRKATFTANDAKDGGERW